MNTLVLKIRTLPPLAPRTIKCFCEPCIYKVHVLSNMCRCVVAGMSGSDMRKRHCDRFRVSLALTRATEPLPTKTSLTSSENCFRFPCGPARIRGFRPDHMLHAVVAVIEQRARAADPITGLSSASLQDLPHDSVPQALSPKPCSSVQLAPCSSRNLVQEGVAAKHREIER